VHPQSSTQGTSKHAQTEPQPCTCNWLPLQSRPLLFFGRGVLGTDERDEQVGHSESHVQKKHNREGSPENVGRVQGVGLGV